MKIVTGSLLLRNASSSSPSRAATAVEVLWLVLLGAAAVALHAAMRHRLEIGPGHQGIWWMAMLMIGRLTSRQQWAGIATATGASLAALLPVWRLGDPLLWLAFAVAGAVVDLGFNGISRTRHAIWALALLGGAAHATKPLLRILLVQFGFRYESLLAGLPFPLTTHFLFGAAGAVIGASIISISRRRP